MAFLKINGFHSTTTGRAEGIGDFLRDVDAAGVPFFAYCADGTTSLSDAQTIMRNSDVPHHAVFRRTTFPHNQGGSDVPDYDEPPEEAAVKQWASHRQRWPKDLDPTLIYGETVNELRKEIKWADWIGNFCYHTALLALQNGFKWCGPGYSAGTPDEGAWETPGMLKFLDLCQQHPGRLAVALHEFSLTVDDIWNESGYLIGRFQQLIKSCEKHNIHPPDIFITEWGWSERNVPKPKQAMKDILEVGKLYAQYPSLKGAAIWGLDGGWGSLAKETARLMDPLKQLLIETRFPEPAPSQPSEPEQEPPPGPGEPRDQYKRDYLVAPPQASLDEWLAICKQAFELKQTVGFSYDDAGLGDLARKTAILYDIPQDKWPEYMDWYAEHYPHTNVTFRTTPASS
ncbi:MAG: hypothetical protein GWP61_14830 [Chloroflexi bacterium]|jgi:hypothetical protein|nr:hypothetical protein [Chloroflexota bacterium]